MRRHSRNDRKGGEGGRGCDKKHPQAKTFDIKQKEKKSGAASVKNAQRNIISLVCEGSRETS